MTKFLDSLTSEYHYLVVPLGYCEALKQHGIKSPAAALTAQALFALAYRRHRQYHGKASGIACRVSLTKLQQMTALSRSAVQASLDKLEKTGLIEKGDTDKRGTLFDVSTLAQIFEKHAKKQTHPKSKKDDSHDGHSPSDDSPNDDCESSTPRPHNGNAQKTIDPAINEKLIEQLKQIESQIEKLRDELNKINNLNDPAAMIRQLRRSLKKGRSAIDDKTLIISEKLTELERERDRIRLEINKIRKALSACKKDRDNSEPLPKTITAKPKRPSRNHIKWMLRRLKEMRVSNPLDTACEILWSLEHGWYAHSHVAHAWKPFQALSSALKLVESGRWRSPSRAEGWRYQQRILVATGMDV